MAEKKHVKDDDKYEALRDKGMSKERTAKYLTLRAPQKKAANIRMEEKRKVAKEPWSNLRYNCNVTVLKFPGNRSQYALIKIIGIKIHKTVIPFVAAKIFYV